MAAPSESLPTPKKTYFLGNICILCGFSFVQMIKQSDGTEFTKKFLDRKLKLTAERKFNIEQVTEMNISEEEGCGVCQKCYRSVEKVIKSEREIKELKGKIKETAKTVASTLLLNLPSPRRKSITKRMLRSPVVQQPMKKTANPILPIVCVNPVKIPLFTDITNIHMKPKNYETVATEKKTHVRRSLGKTFGIEAVQPTTESTQTVLQGEVEVYLA